MHAMWHKTGNTLPVMVNGRQTGSKKGSGAAHQQELQPAEDQLGDAPVPHRGPGAREGAGAGPVQDFYQTNTRARSSLVLVVVLPCRPQVGIVVNDLLV